MKKLFLLIFFSLFMMADLINLNPTELQKKLDEKVIIIDIRTPAEWIETGIISQSKVIMFFDETGKYNIKDWLKEFSRYVKTKEQSFVLVCRSGNRTGAVGRFLAQQLEYKNVFHLEHGIKSWIQEGRVVQKYENTH